MRNNIIFRLSLLAVVFSILACSTITMGDNSGNKTVIGTGSTVEQGREISGISGVDLSTSGTLHISIGNAPSLRIEAQDNLMEYIQTDTKGNTLLIHTTPGVDVKSTRPINYYLTVEKLDNMEISSDGDIEAGNLKSDSLSIKITSSGNVTIDSLDCSSLDVDISSSGNLRVAGGQIQEQKVRISSSGDYEAKNATSASTDVTLTSSGSATVRVSNRLSGRLSSSGHIYYIGSPEVDVRTTSSGKVIQVDS